MTEERHALDDEQWERLGKVLPRSQGGQGRPGGSTRRFLNAVVWLAT
jgi:transposase